MKVSSRKSFYTKEQLLETLEDEDEATDGRLRELVRALFEITPKFNAADSGRFER